MAASRLDDTLAPASFVPCHRGDVGGNRRRVVFTHDISSLFSCDDKSRVVIGTVAGFFVGVVAAVLGVAGRELLIPTMILFFGLAVKFAGSFSLVVSLPTMLVGFARYTQHQSFQVIGQNWNFAILMAAGSILGPFVGGKLLGVVPSYTLLPALACILLLSAWKVWKHSGPQISRR